MKIRSRSRNYFAWRWYGKKIILLHKTVEWWGQVNRDSFFLYSYWKSYHFSTYWLLYKYLEHFISYVARVFEPFYMCVDCGYVCMCVCVLCRCKYTKLSTSNFPHNHVRHTLRLKMAELSTLHLQRSTIFARTCTEWEEFQANGEYTFSSTHTFNVIGSRMKRAIAFWSFHRKKLAHTQRHTSSHTRANSHAYGM